MPTTDTSYGTRSPASASAPIAPDAIMSLVHTTAVKSRVRAISLFMSA